MTSPLNILASRFYEVDLTALRPRFGAVYLLVLRDEIVYVGQTTDLETRIAWHAEQAKIPTRQNPNDEDAPNLDCKPFDRALALRLCVGDLAMYEGALIRALWPRHNRRAPVHTGKDNAVLRALGLPEHADEDANARAWSKSVYQPRPDWRGRPKAKGRDRDINLQKTRARRLFVGLEQLLAARSAS